MRVTFALKTCGSSVGQVRVKRPGQVRVRFAFKQSGQVRVGFAFKRPGQVTSET